MSEHLGVLSASDIGVVYKRRKIPMLITIAITLVLSSYFALTPKSVYRSTAHIQIERQEVPVNLVTSSGNEFGADEIRASTDQIMTPLNLLPVITNANLYPGKRERLSSEALVSKLRSNIDIVTITEDRIHPKTGRPLVEAVAFKVSFDDHSPVKTQQVATMLAELYLRINHQRRTDRAQGASTFIAREADRLNQKISGLEQKLSEFKKKHTYLLPEFANYNLQLLERTHTEINRQKDQIKALVEKRTLLESQLPQPEPVLDPINIARAELAETQQKYTEQHPKVLTLKRAIAALEQQAGNPAEQINSQSTYAFTGNQAGIKARAQLRNVKSNISTARSQLAEMEKNVQDYELRLERSPEVERKYLAVTRDYENALKKYAELKDKEMEARLAEELERAQKGERFSLLKPAPLPVNPIGPNRIGIMSLGLAVSLLGSFLLASFLEYLDPTVRGTEGVNAVLHAPPLGVVPYISA